VPAQGRTPGRAVGESRRSACPRLLRHDDAFRRIVATRPRWWSTRSAVVPDADDQDAIRALRREIRGPSRGFSMRTSRRRFLDELPKFAGGREVRDPFAPGFDMYGMRCAARSTSRGRVGANAHAPCSGDPRPCQELRAWRREAAFRPRTPRGVAEGAGTARALRTQSPAPPELIAGTLAYMAPEQRAREPLH